MLIWGWTRWAVDQPEPITIPSVSSLTGFILASASAALAVSSIAYAQLTGGFAFYDLRLLRIFRWGCLLSFLGLIFGIRMTVGDTSKFALESDIN